MEIVNCSGNMKKAPGLDALLSQLESASFADECRYVLKDCGRRFCCIFVRNGRYLKECCWHVKHLLTLTNDINILENKSKEMDSNWDE